MLLSPVAHADYLQGCADPKYKRYVEEQFVQFDARNRRLLDSTLREYDSSLRSSDNPFLVISNLSRHLKYSAQFDPTDVVEAKIDRIFEHANDLSVAQQIAGDVFDRFSAETHSVGIARAWIAYRQGLNELAFDELLKSLDVTDSAVLSTFGPDFELVRLIYRDGHVEPVIAYLEKTERFWVGQHADELRNVWRNMMNAKCEIQFDSVDAIKAKELGLAAIDINKLLD